MPASAIARLPGIPVAALGWAGLVAVLAAPVVVDPSAAYPGVTALLPTLGAAALIAAGDRRGSPGRLLAVAPLRFLGRISYSLYLWHWPILVLPAVALGAPLDPGVRAALIAASVVVATASWACVEEPFRRGSWRLAMRPSRALAVAATGLAFVVAFSGGLWVRQASDLGLAAPWPFGEVEPVAGADDGIDWTAEGPDPDDAEAWAPVDDFGIGCRDRPRPRRSVDLGRRRSRGPDGIAHRVGHRVAGRVSDHIAGRVAHDHAHRIAAAQGHSGASRRLCAPEEHPAGGWTGT